LLGEGYVYGFVVFIEEFVVEYDVKGMLYCGDGLYVLFVVLFIVLCFLGKVIVFGDGIYFVSDMLYYQLV